MLEHVLVAAEREAVAIVPEPTKHAAPESVAGARSADYSADVVIVGFGGAGACAALEAVAAGASVIVIERFTGGGATALSGGVVYAGGGTLQQMEAGVADSPDAMFDYLMLEVGDAVTPATLRSFCEGSAGQMAWLAGLGVPFEGSLCLDKTSYPTNRHYLYYSGSERSFGHIAPPAPRGHRAVGRGTSGHVLFAPLAAAVRSSAAVILDQTTARRLITDADGRVVAVECSTLRGAPGLAAVAHRVLHRWSAKPYLYLPKLGRALHRWVDWLERRYGRPIRVAAERGVVLTAGGFAANKPMMRAHAPAYRGGLPLATPGDDGSGIRLGTEVGGATRFLDRVSAWRFISPPSALLRGVLVDQAGRRVCDESRYGAAIGEALIRRSGGRAWLVIDRAIVADARRELRASTLWFQRLQAWYLLTIGRTQASSLAAAAARAGVDPDGLAETGAGYNSAAQAGEPDRAGKAADLVTAIARPPYSLIDLSVRPRLAYPTPMLTLGGLVVAEDSGQVLRPDGSPVHGLFAAGRSAVGLCSNSYVSGLSLADCVFAGRRAGQGAAAAVGAGRDSAGADRG
jgi:3-oxo-5alpha-steroid 4-dehydrogenase